MKQAAFSLKHYTFTKVDIDYLKKSDTPDISIDIKPSGIFDKEDSNYKLSFIFSATTNDDKPFIVVVCDSIFRLKNVKSIEEIPSFFYKNSIAILFPYIRAFVSTITLQANREPMILPTMNLSVLESTLKEHTREI
jgi:preprotein translocase subunit SecB